MTKEQVTELNCKKHVKIYKLKQLRLSNKENVYVLIKEIKYVIVV